jgi:hypothetical protein
VFCAGREQIVVCGVHCTGEAVDGPILTADIPLLPPQKNRSLTVPRNQIRLIIAGFCKNFDDKKNLYNF